MSCYSPLLGEVRDTRKATITFCNVIVTLFAFLLMFMWFSMIVGKQKHDHFTLNEQQSSEDVLIPRFQQLHTKENNVRNNQSDDEIEVTTTERPPKTETAATFFPAKTTTFDPVNEIYKEELTTQNEPKTETAATLFPAKTTTFDPTIFKFSSCGKRIVGYYNGWNNQKLSENQLLRVTHLVMAFMKIHENGTISFENEEKKQLFSEMKQKAKNVNPGVKVMFSIGGMYNSEHFSKITRNFRKRENFINFIISFLEEYQFDGVDVFWKWPESKDKANYIFLLRELRKKLQEPRLLSVVTPSVGFELMEGFHLKGILNHVDFINVETDKMNRKNGPGAFTGAPTPLYSEIGQYKEDNVDWTMRHMVCTTRKPNQINMGIPFYGRFWKGVQGPVEKGDDMWRAVGESEADGHVASGVVFWRNMESEGWNIKESSTWHQESKTPYVWDENNRMFLGFENEKSLKEKLKYAVDNNLGGLTIWTLEMDDDVDSLLKAVTSSDVHCQYSESDNNSVKYECVY